MVFIKFFNYLMDVSSALKICSNFEVVNFHSSEILSALMTHVIDCVEQDNFKQIFAFSGALHVVFKVSS